MPTLGLNIQLTLADDKTRNDIDSFYRGIKVKGITLRPYVTITNNTDVYDVSNTNCILFISDVFQGSNPFDITLVTYDVDMYGKNKEITLKAVGLMLLDVYNVKTVKVSSSVNSAVAYRLIS